MAVTVTHAETGVGPSNKVTAADWEAAHVITGGIQSATVTLTSAQILALHTTPVTLVAAPGAGKVLIVHKTVVLYKYGTVAYDYTGAGPDVRVSWAGAGSFEVLGLLNASSDSLRTTSPNLGTTSVDVATATYANLALTVIPVSGAFTLGDGTLTVTAYYTVEDVP